MKQKSFTQYGLLLGFCITLAACSISKPWAGPASPSAVDYRYSRPVGNTPLMRWFELYRDTVLRNMISTALDNNKDLLIATVRIEEAAAQAAITRANLYPSLYYQGKAGGGKAGTDARKVAGGNDGAVFNGYAVLNWEIDLWGKLRGATRSQVANYLSVVDTRNSLQVSLVAEVASQYFLLRDLDNRLLIAKQTLESRKEYTRIIAERFDKGYIPELDKLQAIQQESDVAAGIPGLQRQIAETENSIRLLMGQPPGTVMRGYSIVEQVLSTDIPVGLPSQLLQRRPDVASAEQTLRAQFERIGVAQANRFPAISLTGLLGFASPQLSSILSNSGFVANGFGSITGPIFNFNQLKNQVKLEQKRTLEATYQYEQTVLGAFRDVDNSLTYLKSYSEEYEQRKVQADASAKALILTNARYNQGFTSFLEVLVQQDNLFDAQNQQSLALQGKLNSIVMLYKSLGGGW